MGSVNNELEREGKTTITQNEKKTHATLEMLRRRCAEMQGLGRAGL